MNTEERKAYNEKCRRESGECRAKCEREHGTEDNPKADLLWQKAWEQGHSSGLHEVAIVYADIAELVL